MKFHHLILYTVFLNLYAVTLGFAQKISNVKVEINNDEVFVTYDLIEESKADSAFIRVYSSLDYSNNLKMVSGDVNKIVPAGREKKIIWKAGKELTEFNGMLRIRIMCPPTIPQLQDVKYKKGRKIFFTWLGGGGVSEKYKIELIAPNGEIKQIAETKNTGKYELQLSKKIKRGNGYKIRLSNILSEHESAMSAAFNIVPVIPMLYKVGVPVATGAIVGAILYFGATIPEPPNPPNPDN